MTLNIPALRAFIDAWPDEINSGYVTPSPDFLPLPSQLRDFSDAWAVATRSARACSVEPPLPVQLRSFFETWPQVWTEIIPPQEPTINADALRSFFQDFCPAFEKIKKERLSGSAVNVWRAAGLKRDELRNSRVLAWFLDAHGDHGQGSALLERLLDRINRVTTGERKECSLPRTEDVRDRYWTRLESYPLGDTDSRVDIEIEGDKFLLFIEVKIDAGETNKQLDRYVKIAAHKANGRRWAVVFLTPNGRQPSGINARVSRNHPNVVSVSWRGVSEAFHTHANALPDCFARRLIQQYRQYIQQF